MRKFIKGHIYLLSTGIILCMFSCTSESCFEETEAFLKASFYSNINETNVILAPDSITVYGLNMVSDKIYNKASKIQTALLPLNSSAENCIFIIKINGITDTLEFKYSNYTHLISKECGYSFFHKLDTAPPIFSENAIKGIYINKSTITNLNEENIRIFY